MKAVNRSTGEVVYFRPACKQWSCPVCGRLREWYWITTARYGASLFLEQGVALDFITITSHENLNSTGSFAVLGHAWDNLRRRVKREVETTEYFVVPEPHKDGRWHLHGLVTARLKKKWWKDNARAVGFGFQADAKPVESDAAAANYLTKYLGKSLQNTNLPKHFRRVRLSKGWPELPGLPGTEVWIFAVLEPDTALGWDVSCYQAADFDVVLADEKSAWEWIEKATTE